MKKGNRKDMTGQRKNLRRENIRDEKVEKKD
jgi:hypothetical protein